MPPADGFVSRKHLRSLTPRRRDGDDDAPEEAGPRRFMGSRRACPAMRRVAFTIGRTYLRIMKDRRTKKIVAIQTDLGSPASVDRFRVLAASFTSRASSSREAALSVLQREGIVTAKGNLTKNYSAK